MVVDASVVVVSGAGLSVLVVSATGGVGGSDSTPCAAEDDAARSGAESSSRDSEGPSWVADAKIGAAETPSAVGTSVTSLRTLPTAAAAMVTATTVAASHAAPIPPNLLIPIVWYWFSDTGLKDG